MNVNCKVSLTDEQRNKMFKKLNGSDSKKMVSRADVNEFVKEKIDEAVNGTFGIVVDVEKQTVKINGDASESISNFKPSRGDEPYMFEAKDESLRAIHSRMLDCIEEYERAVSVEMEKNRK